MKIKKTYALSEETLEKDIDQFIQDAKRGHYQFDYKHRQEGLKLIRAYFRMIEDEFKRQNFQDARACYKKLMFLLLQSEDNYFDYGDIVGMLNFDRFLTNYFISLSKTCSTAELFHEYVEYLKVKENYYFEPVHPTIITQLRGNDLHDFVALVKSKAEGIAAKDYELYDMIYFLLDAARFKKDRAEFDRICKSHEKFIDGETFDVKD